MSLLELVSYSKALEIVTLLSLFEPFGEIISQAYIVADVCHSSKAAHQGKTCLHRLES